MVTPPGEYCVCGNMLANATVVMRVSPCRCKEPAPATPFQLSTTKKGCVRRSVSDVMEYLDRSEDNAYGEQLIRGRARRNLENGNILI